ncbi:MAG: hypothetical protein WAM14_15465 [Candidatus Nitrosopolaris sp.]
MSKPLESGLGSILKPVVIIEDAVIVNLLVVNTKKEDLLNILQKNLEEGK